MRKRWLPLLICACVVIQIGCLPTGPPEYETTASATPPAHDGKGGESKDDDYGGKEMFDQIIETNEAFDTEVIEGDIKYSEDDVYTHEDGRREIRSAVKNQEKLWPNGEVPYRVSEGMSYQLRRFVFDAMKQIQDVTCIKFRRRTPADSHYVKFFDGDGCWSWVGRRTGEQKISLSSRGCKSRGIAMHEMLHALGFWHEQARPDRDNYIKIIWDNIKQKAKTNFKARTVEEAQFFTEYDFESILHYSAKAFSKNGKQTIEPIGFPGKKLGQRDHLTLRDIEGVNKLYKCTESSSGRKIINGTVIGYVGKTSRKTTVSHHKAITKIVAKKTTANHTGTTHTTKNLPETGKASLIINNGNSTESSGPATWLKWGNWGRCSHYCSRTRIRLCSHPRPNACGTTKRKEKETESIPCNESQGCDSYYGGYGWYGKR